MSKAGSKNIIRFRSLALIVLGVPAFLAGNNGSAMSSPTGGIQLTREPRISMETEKLSISRDRITVEYEFLNGSNSPITTEVAFPVPPYGTSMYPDLT